VPFRCDYNVTTTPVNRGTRTVTEDTPAALDTWCYLRRRRSAAPRRHQSRQFPKLRTRVRFPSPAPDRGAQRNPSSSAPFGSAPISVMKAPARWSSTGRKAETPSDNRKLARHRVARRQAQRPRHPSARTTAQTGNRRRATASATTARHGSASMGRTPNARTERRSRAGCDEYRWALIRDQYEAPRSPVIRDANGFGFWRSARILAEARQDRWSSASRAARSLSRAVA